MDFSAVFSYFQVMSGPESLWGLRYPWLNSAMNKYLADAEFNKIK